jgi:hypothetical protein
MGAFLVLMAGYQYFAVGPFLDHAVLYAANAKETSVRLSFAFNFVFVFFHFFLIYVEPIL